LRAARKRKTLAISPLNQRARSFGSFWNLCGNAFRSFRTALVPARYARPGLGSSEPSIASCWRTCAMFAHLRGECDILIIASMKININFLRQELPLRSELSAHLQASVVSPPACLLAPMKFLHQVPKLGLPARHLRLVVHRAYQLQLR
jgi:hypothetical protein